MRTLPAGVSNVYAPYKREARSSRCGDALTDSSQAHHSDSAEPALWSNTEAPLNSVYSLIEPLVGGRLLHTPMQQCGPTRPSPFRLSTRGYISMLRLYQ
jgi:hypothetical protein